LLVIGDFHDTDFKSVNKAPKIYVVTPYYKESLEVLRRCHDSVLGQQEANCDITHVMVADGFARPEIDDWGVAHVKLPSAHGDNGNTPRALGAMLAQAEGAYFIAYLDADNWFYPSHLASMLGRHQETRAQVVCCMREFYDPSGQKIAVTESDEDALRHVDTSCLLIHRSAFATNSLWMMPRQLSPICDRIFFKGVVHSRYHLAFTQKRTVGFTTLYASHYNAVGWALPAGVKDRVDEEPVKYLTSVEGVRETVERLGFWPY
jgi:glycosyltransferase involved in cell wall biosynthesis